MSIDVTTVPNPLFSVPTRSAIEEARRALLLHWSAGRYLDAVVGNYGFKRSVLGFSDDDFFRAIAQVVMADYKNIGSAFWQILEIALGPYKNMAFSLESQVLAGDSYFDIAKDIEYVTYSSWNSSDFQLGESISNGSGVSATVIYHDEEDDTVYFIERSGGSFASGDTIAGISGSITSSSTELVHSSNAARPVSSRFPLYGTATIRSEFYDSSIDSGTSTLTLDTDSASGVDDFYNGWSITITSGAALNDVRTVTDYDASTGILTVDSAWSSTPTTVSSFKLIGSEDVVYASVDKYLRRARVVSNFNLSHNANSAIFLSGGCWDLINTRARRLAVKIKCDNVLNGGIPGSSYLHPYPYKYACLREDAAAGATSLKHDFSVLDGVPTPPFTILIDPEERGGPLEEFSVSSYNATTMTFTSASGVSRRLRRGTRLRWVQADYVTGGITTTATIATPQLLKLAARIENPVGVWVIGRGTANEEFVFVKNTTYQKRQLMADLTTSSTKMYLDFPLDGYPEGTLSSALTFRISDETGLLGTVTSSTISNYTSDGHMCVELTLGSSPSFSTDIENYQTLVELVDATNGEVTWELASELDTAHGTSVTVERLFGTTPTIPTDASHLPEAGWTPSSVTGKWPGPYVYSMERKAPVNIRSDSSSSIEALGYVSRSDASDCRIYMANEDIVVDYDKNKALKTLPRQFVTDSSGNVFEFQPYDIEISDASFFPTTAQVNAWRLSTSNPNKGYPIELVVGGEGGFGRNPVYYWGKSTSSGRNVIYVSGVERIHLSGARVATYHTEIPVGADSGVLGVSDGIPLTENYLILDHMHENEEIISYDTLDLESPNRAILNFERGFSPLYSHEPFQTSNIDGSVIGVRIARTTSNGVSYPRNDGYSFPFMLHGDIILLRLSYALSFVKTAGVDLEFYDSRDRRIICDYSSIFKK
jgi:hypothetical protein